MKGLCVLFERSFALASRLSTITEAYLVSYILLLLSRDVFISSLNVSSWTDVRTALLSVFREIVANVSVGYNGKGGSRMKQQKVAASND